LRLPEKRKKQPTSHNGRRLFDPVVVAQACVKTKKEDMKSRGELAEAATIKDFLIVRSEVAHANDQQPKINQGLTK
jgi:hypothetical protein